MDKRRGAREAAAALVALKYRAISLLEVYARKVRVLSCAQQQQQQQRPSACHASDRLLLVSLS